MTISGDLPSSFVEECAKFVEYKGVPIEMLEIHIQSIKLPRGKGRLQVTKNTIRNKKSVITIKNSDSICLARAIVTAHANLNKDRWSKSNIKNGFNQSRQLQGEMAVKLHDDTGVEMNELGSTLEDVKAFAKHLGIQISIIDADQFNDIIFTTDNDYDSSQMIYLFKNKNHLM